MTRRNGRYCDWCTEGHPELAPWPLCEPGAGDVVDAGCAAAVVDGSTEDANGSNVDNDDDDEEEEAPMLVDISSAAAAAAAAAAAVDGNVGGRNNATNADGSRGSAAGPSGEGTVVPAAVRSPQASKQNMRPGAQKLKRKKKKPKGRRSTGVVGQSAGAK